MSLPGLKLLWFPNIFREQHPNSLHSCQDNHHSTSTLCFSYCPPPSSQRADTGLPETLLQPFPLLECPSPRPFMTGFSSCRSQPKCHHLRPFLIILHILYPTPHPQLLSECSLKHSLYSTYHYSNKDYRCILLYHSVVVLSIFYLNALGKAFLPISTGSLPRCYLAQVLDIVT